VNTQFASSFDDTQRRRHGKLAATLLPGAGYCEVLRWIHEFLRPASYLEIGIRKGESLRIAREGTLCLGIDPHPMIAAEQSRGMRIFEATSDDFFRQQNLPALLGAPHFALAFIDGLHLWEQALRDFINLERYAGPGSVILIHDCLPLDELTSARTRSTAFHTGDVWKLALCLRQERPDLKMTTVRTNPSGLCIVTHLDPASTFLSDRFEELVGRYTHLGFADYQNSGEKLPVPLVNDRDAIAAWLSEASVPNT